MAHELQRLQHRHYKMAELVLAGINLKEIAAITGMSEVGVGGIVNSPLFQDYIARRRHKREQLMDQGYAGGVHLAVERASEEALASVEKLVEIRDTSKDEDTQLKSISQILAFARTGVDTSGNPSGQGPVVPISGQQIQVFIQVLDEDRQARHRHQAHQSNVPEVGEVSMASEATLGGSELRGESLTPTILDSQLEPSSAG